MKEIELEYALRCTKGNLAMEGLICPKEIEEIHRMLLKGDIDKEKSIREMLKY